MSFRDSLINPLTRFINYAIMSAYERGDIEMVAKFNTPGAALSFINRAEAMLMAVHGNDGLIWVVTPAQYIKLEAAGYEPVAW
jgi:hypothetical protein